MHKHKSSALNVSVVEGAASSLGKLKTSRGEQPKASGGCCSPRGEDLQVIGEGALPRKLYCNRLSSSLKSSADTLTSHSDHLTEE